jgi:hypothetical protein
VGNRLVGHGNDWDIGQVIIVCAEVELLCQGKIPVEPEVDGVDAEVTLRFMEVHSP